MDWLELHVDTSPAGIEPVSELLEQQGYHEVGIRVFFWENHIVGTLHLAESFRIHDRIEAEDLLQLGIQEAIQSGHCS